MLDKIAGGKFRSRVFRSGREHLDDFVRVDEPALAHADDFLVVFGQRFDGLQFVGGPEGDEHTAAARARDAHHHVAQFAGRRIGNAGAHHHLLQPQAFGRRRQSAHKITQFIPPKIERRPHVQEYPIPMEALIGRPPRLKQPDAGQRFRQHALQMRQLHDATRLIPHRRYVAHFCAREQPLILRVIAGNGVEQVDIFDRRQPFNLEIAEPPEMQPLAPSWGGFRGRASPLHTYFRSGR